MKIVRSKFRPWVLLLLLMILMFLFALYIVIVKIYIEKNEKPTGMIYFATFISVLMLVVTIFGELRKRVISVIIENDIIKTRNFLGIGKTRIFSFHELDSFRTIKMPSNYAEYEYMYLIKQGKKVVTLSQFYHKNYKEIKRIITRKVKNEGVEEYTILSYFRNLF